MKTRDQLNQLKKMSLVDLKNQALELEKSIHMQAMAVEFGKKKDVSTVRNLKRHLARTLTIANASLKSTDKKEQA